MAKGNVSLQAFNRGIIGKSALARVDLERTGLSAEIQTNFMPRTLGSMSLRPGFKNIQKAIGQSILIDFIFATDDTALIEMSNGAMRVSVDDEFISRVSNSSNILNGNFVTDIADFTDADESNCTSQHVTGDFMGLTGTGFNSAIRRQEVTVLAGDQGTQHALRVEVERGVVRLRVGSSAGAEDYLEEVTLTKGTHSITFTPTANFHVQLASSTLYETLVTSCTVEGSGILSLPTIYTTSDLEFIRWDQSGDVIFLATKNVMQQRIERRDNDSWSIVEYLADDGPFLLADISGTTITPSAITGDITLTASANIFKSTMVGGLFQLTSSGQEVTAAFTAVDQATGEILITGSGDARDIEVDISGTFTGTVLLEQSVGVVGLWTEFAEYTAPTTTTINDGFDDSIIYYRFRMSVHSSGTADVILTTSSGSIKGVARVVGYTSETVVDAIVVKPLGGTDATSTWSEGAWSPRNGYPSTVIIYESRLWFFGKGGIWGSLTDAYTSYDEDFTGDAGPIIRNIGFGPVDTISWALRLLRLVTGTQGSELSLRSSSFDEPLTSLNFNIKDPSNQGSAEIAAIKVDSGGFFVQRSGVRLYEIEYQSKTFDYGTRDVTVHVPEIGRPRITRIAVQRQPDTRVHCVRSDGTVAVLVTDKAEEVLAWVDVITEGEVEEVRVLPGTDEDQVYYVVNRDVSGVETRFIERWAIEKEIEIKTFHYVGDPISNLDVKRDDDVHWEDGTILSVRNPVGTLFQNATVSDGKIQFNSPVTDVFITNAMCPMADNYREYSNPGSATSVLTGLEDFEGKQVVCWADGKDQGTFTVSSGQITLSESVEYAVVGYGYRGRYKSVKLTYAAESGTAIGQIKRVEHLGVVLRWTHNQGLKHGPTFNELSDMPKYEHHLGAMFSDYVHEDYDREMLAFDGPYDTDSRVCIEANAPRPCTALALVVGMDTNERI